LRKATHYVNIYLTQFARKTTHYVNIIFDTYLHILMKAGVQVLNIQGLSTTEVDCLSKISTKTTEVDCLSKISTKYKVAGQYIG